MVDIEADVVVSANEAVTVGAKPLALVATEAEPAVIEAVTLFTT